jgi:drug/metabolite transporter (DMT)-like permease
VIAQNTKSGSEATSTILGMAAIALWSTTVAFGRSLAEQLGPLTTACLIYTSGGVLGCAYLALSGRFRATLRSTDRRYLLGCGALFTLYIACLYLALGLAHTRSQVLEVGLVNYLWPMLTLLFSVPVLRMRARSLFVPGAFVAMAGVLLATTQNQPLSWHSLRGNLVQNSTPYILGLLGAVSWGLYSTLSRRWAAGAQGGAVALFMLGTGIALGLGRLLFTEPTRWTSAVWLELGYMAVGTNLAYAFWERAMRGGDIILVAASSYFTPLLSTIVSTLYLSVVAGPRLWIGCGLVVAGAIACKLSVEPSPSRPARPSPPPKAQDGGRAF